MPIKQDRSAPGQGMPNGDASTLSLRQTVKQELLKVLTDPAAPAASKASAGRTLLEYFDDGENARGAGSGKRGAELSLDELDAEIERESGHKPGHK